MKARKRLAALLMILTMIASVGISSFANGVPTEAMIQNLYANRDMLVGTVSVWNDEDTLHVLYKLNQEALDEGWRLTETHLHVGASLDEFPTARKGNPVPGRFDYSGEHEWVSEVHYTVDLMPGWMHGDELLVAAHADISKEVCQVLVEAGSDMYCSDTVETMVTSGSAASVYPHSAVEAYPSPLDTQSFWNARLVHEDTSEHFVFNPCAMWIWESALVDFPVIGSDYLFERTFEIPGIPSGGSIQIAADNGAAVFLNGHEVVVSNLPQYPNLGDYGFDYVTAGWQQVRDRDISSFLVTGTNTLVIHGVNKNQPGGNILSNPAGVIYQFDTSWDEITECWIESEGAWAQGERFVRTTWGMYFTYLLEGECHEWSGELISNPLYHVIEELDDETIYFDVRLCEAAGGDCGTIVFDLPEGLEDIYAVVEDVKEDYPYWFGDNFAAVGTCEYGGEMYYFMFMINTEKIWISLTFDDYSDEWADWTVTHWMDREFQLHSIAGEYTIY